MTFEILTQPLQDTNTLYSIIIITFEMASTRNEKLGTKEQKTNHRTWTDELLAKK